MSKDAPAPRPAENADDAGAREAVPDGRPPRVVNSEVLLEGAPQLAIRHNESIYFLRQTRFGKLILTK